MDVLKSKRMKIVLAVLLVAAAAIGGYLLYAKFGPGGNSLPMPPPPPAPLNTPSPPPSPSPAPNPSPSPEPAAQMRAQFIRREKMNAQAAKSAVIQRSDRVANPLSAVVSVADSSSDAPARFAPTSGPGRVGRLI